MAAPKNLDGKLSNKVRWLRKTLYWLHEPLHIWYNLFLSIQPDIHWAGTVPNSTLYICYWKGNCTFLCWKSPGRWWEGASEVECPADGKLAFQWSWKSQGLSWHWKYSSICIFISEPEKQIRVWVDELGLTESRQVEVLVMSRWT